MPRPYRPARSAGRPEKSDDKRGAVGLRRSKGAARATISCRKSEIRVSLPHEQSCASAWPKIACFRPGVLSTPEKGARNFLSAKKPRNPLKSLDSDERIQGNPRKSNAQKRGLQ